MYLLKSCISYNHVSLQIMYLLKSCISYNHVSLQIMYLLESCIIQIISSTLVWRTSFRRFQPPPADRPTPPENVQVSDIFAEHCKLSWKPPEDDGNGEILGTFGGGGEGVLWGFYGGFIGALGVFLWCFYGVLWCFMVFFMVIL